MQDDLPASVKAILGECIDSVEQLEILVLLWRARPRRWTARQMSEELRTNQQSTGERLEELVKHGLAAVREEAGERIFELAAGRRERAVAALVEAYDTRRVSVITFVVTKPVERIRSFADAFRLRRNVDG